MNYKNLLIGGFFVSSLIVAIISYVGFFTGIGESLFYFFAVFTILFPALLLLGDVFFKSWLKLSIPMVILSILFIFLTPEYGGGGGIGLDLAPDRGAVGKLSATILLISSFLLVLWKLFRVHKENSDKDST